MALTKINIESWEDIPEGKQASVCHKVKGACEEAGVSRSQIQFGITDRSVIYTSNPSGPSPIESSLSRNLEPTVIQWVNINDAMVFVLAHMLVLSHLYPGCRFTVEPDPRHQRALKRACAIARGAIPELPVPAWLDQLEPLDGSSIVRPDRLDFTR
ncbi:hypothetical protein [Marinobacter sp.]|jgi:hypothetical protein|uniref:hypothetical protein n=1 Tax=Marinobacter sp. TaxID=50741 RepID=UPI002636D61D|nr:hypothetical protein [Marinobacter sp.]